MGSNNELTVTTPDSGINEMPLLPLRDVVVYPHMVIPLFVGRSRSILALEAAAATTKHILLVTQKESSEDNPDVSGMYHVGTVSNILQLLKLPDGTVKVLVEGVRRAKITDFLQNNPYFQVRVHSLVTGHVDDKQIEVLLRSLLSQFEQYVKLNNKIPPEVFSSLSGIDEPIKLVDTVAAHMSLKISEKQKVLEIADLKERIDSLMAIMESEIDLLQVEKRIRTQVKRQMEKSQREYYLNEQMKAIQKELGEIGEEGGNEIDVLFKKIEQSGMHKDAKDKCINELNKLKMMSPMSAEATVCRSYIDWMLAVPWKKRSKVRANLKEAESILDEQHYGLEKIKERIVEYLAVQRRVQKVKGPILCLVGPPGVGKTSLGKSIAKATQRNFVRISLGGVRDEAEIRGHRRTYIGAMPGKILQKISKTGVCNPLFLLDEIDKMAMDFRGDPASALLEVLDPEQNSSFNDHYLEVDYDLSDVMFIATANSLDIPAPLLDRMEVIRIAGYTENEKLSIAENYLLPKQIKNNGLKKQELTITQDSLLEIIRYYTRESGVRSLEREISKVSRKVLRKILTDNDATKFTVNPEDLEDLIGVRKYRLGQIDESNRIGQVTGLAWTEVGGEILTLEAVSVPGKGKVINTGKLGDVMQESIQAAITVVRTRAKSLGIVEDFYEKQDLHIHVPEGATPKDGPSAGIGMCTAIVSILTQIPVLKNVAMTGEITLRGQVLPIGGLKEKLLAAKRAGINLVIIPQDNMRDLKEIPESITDGLQIEPVTWIEDVWKLALEKMPKTKGGSKVGKESIKTSSDKEVRH